MSLLRDIQEASIDANVDVSVVLRKCKVLAARLGNEDFKKWVDSELNGYRDTQNLPDYRIFRVNSKGNFSGYFGRVMNNLDVSVDYLPAKRQIEYLYYHATHSIATYSSLLNSEGSGNLSVPWPPEVVYEISEIYADMHCMSAWQVIPRAAIVGLIESVRNRILGFVLEIESEAPDAGGEEPTIPPLPPERVGNVFHTHIYGNVGNVAAGSTDFTQTATISVNQGNLSELKDYLSSLGVPSGELDALETAIARDNSVDHEGGIGDAVSGWVGRLMTKIEQGTIPVLQSVKANLITKALLLYYGIDTPG